LVIFHPFTSGINPENCQKELFLEPFSFVFPFFCVLYLCVFVLFASRIALGNCQKQKNEIKMKMKKTHEDEHEQHEKKAHTISSPWLPEMNIT
jgi:hypothetical protein